MTLDDMIAVKREGERRLRSRFAMEWGAFAKCDVCGAAEPPEADGVRAAGRRCPRIYGARYCQGTMRAAGYSPPPREAQ